MSRFVSGYNNESATHPARPSFGMFTVISESYYCMQTATPILAFSKARSNNLKENATNGSMISASTCYTLHGILVAIHIFLLFSYISHWEHRVTLPFTSKNDDVWSVVLSASLQAFYTVRVHCYVFLVGYTYKIL